MKCKKCRKEIPDDAKFCCYCGIPIERKKLNRRKDGLYEKVITINGSRKSFYGKTEKEVFQKIADFDKETEKLKEGLPFNAVAEQWENETYQTIAYNTEKGYRPKTTRAKEYFEDIPITAITIQDINRYINQFPKTWAAKTVTGYFSVINLIFSYACRCGYIEHNPCEYAKLPKGLKKAIDEHLQMKR